MRNKFLTWNSYSLSYFLRRILAIFVHYSYRNSGMLPFLHTCWTRWTVSVLCFWPTLVCCRLWLCKECFPIQFNVLNKTFSAWAPSSVGQQGCSWHGWRCYPGEEEGGFIELRVYYFQLNVWQCIIFDQTTKCWWGQFGSHQWLISFTLRTNSAKRHHDWKTLPYYALLEDTWATCIQWHQRTNRACKCYVTAPQPA